MDRPFKSWRIEQLETHVAQHRHDRAELLRVLRVLAHRDVQRASKLRAEVERALAPVHTPQAPPVAAPPPVPEPQELTTPLSRAGGARDAPSAVLSAWTALEVLEPPNGYTQPGDLIGRRDGRIVKLDGPVLPWAEGQARPPPKKKLFFQVVLGSVDLSAAFVEL